MKKQTTSKTDNWLYMENEYGRQFFKDAYLADNASEYPECTDAEKQAWEEAHKPEEPQQAEEQTTE